jgi:hypothetical protein
MANIQFLPGEMHDRMWGVVSFLVMVDGEQICCAISIEALMDHFGANYSDPMPAFLANRHRIEHIAGELLASGQLESDGTVLIRN